MEQLQDLFQLPLQDPVLIFFIVLSTILLSPIILNKLHIPQIVGLILAGVAFGPHGFGLLDYDSSFKLFGQVGVLYIMFLAGVEMDMDDFRKNRGKSLVFGILTFAIPMLLGIATGYFLMEDLFASMVSSIDQIIWTSGEPSTEATFVKYCILSAVVLASMYASNTLVAYPIVSRLGVSRNRSVTITIGGTMITTILSLLVLVICLEMVKQGSINLQFWLKFGISNILFALFMFVLIPRIGRWFFKRVEDSISQYIFVLAIVFLSSFMAKLAGIEYIIGAFLAGINLNRLIPKRSPLMNRIDFVGNAIFIPFFLISVGMIVDFRVIFSGYGTILTAVVMSVIATLSKYWAAIATRLSFRMSKLEGRMIFGLSNAQAAATLAAVMIAYNVIIGCTDDGTEIRLLTTEILNGTIVMILVTCTISSIITERAAKEMAIQPDLLQEEKNTYRPEHRILIPIANPETIESLVDLAVLINDKKVHPIYALNVVVDNSQESMQKGKKLLEKAAVLGSASDNKIKRISRYDLNIASGIINVVKEKNISDVIIGLHHKASMGDSFLGSMTDSLLSNINRMVCIFKSTQPIATIKRLIVIAPEKAEFESGFQTWCDRIYTLAQQLGAQILFCGTEDTLAAIFAYAKKKRYNSSTSSKVLPDWDDFLMVSGLVKENDLVIVISARKASLSYSPLLDKLPKQLATYFKEYSYIVLYPEQFKEGEEDKTLDAHKII